MHSPYGAWWGVAGGVEQINIWHGAWSKHVMREKAIYHTLNMFNVDSSQQCYVAEAWCPVEDLEEVRAAIRRGDRSSSVPAVVNLLHPKESPPTFFRSSKVAVGTQASLPPLPTLHRQLPP